MSYWTEDIEILHIYSQPWYHQEARIIGTRKGLEKLRDQLDEVLKYNCIHPGGITTNENYFVNDGEGYELEIEVIPAKDIDNEPEPYTDIEACPGSFLNDRRKK